MPESRPRKKAAFTAPPTGRKPARIAGARWIAPAMCTCWILGLAWIVVYYIAPDMKYLSELGNWNLVVGMVFIAFGFVLSTKWE